MVGRLYHLGRRRARARAGELLERFDLDRRRRPAGRRPTPAACAAGSTSPARWSPGRRCCSSTSRPPGSTRAAAPSMWEFIADLVAGGTTLLLTTQYLEEADRLADRIVVIDHGKVIARGHRRRAEGPGRRRAARGHRRRGGPARRRRAGCWPRSAGGEPQVDEHTRRLPCRSPAAPRCSPRRCAGSTRERVDVLRRRPAPARPSTTCSSPSPATRPRRRRPADDAAADEPAGSREERA